MARVTQPGDGTFDIGGQQAHSLVIPPFYPLGSDATLRPLLSSQTENFW
jgi:hypothetical protein